MHQLASLAVLFTGVYFIYFFASAIWNIYFHPLRNIPGPKSWIAFPICRHYAHTQGRLDLYIQEFHRKYGEVVRFGPNEVSFITAQAWKDIYGHGRHQLEKVQFFRDTETSDIINANDTEHTRFRKALSHGFSAKALQGQEPILSAYVDKLLERLRQLASSGTSADMVKWYNLTTFDMIGDLAFGESFGGLEHQRLHFWVSTIFNYVKVLSYMQAAVAYPLISKLMTAAIPQSLKGARMKQMQYVEDTVSKRLNKGSLPEREDFIDSMLRHRGGKDGLSDKELVANASILVIAGSETTATVLSGATYWLLRTPQTLKKVTEEVRSAFQSEDEINFTNTTARLPYMLACLNEALRIYPPVPTGLQRVTPPNQITRISNYDMVPGTKVAVTQLAAYKSLPARGRGPRAKA